MMGRRKLIVLVSLLGLTLVNILLARFVIKPLKMKEEALLKSSENLKKQIAAKANIKKPRIVFEVEDIHPIEHLQMAQGIPRDKVVFPPEDPPEDTQNVGQNQAPNPPIRVPEFPQDGSQNLQNQGRIRLDAGGVDPFIYPGELSSQDRSRNAQDMQSVNVGVPPGPDGMPAEDNEVKSIKENLERLRNSVKTRAEGYVSEQSIPKLPDTNEKPIKTEEVNPYNNIRSIGEGEKTPTDLPSQNNQFNDDFLRANSILNALKSNIVAPKAALLPSGLESQAVTMRKDSNFKSRPLHELLNFVQQRQKDMASNDNGSVQNVNQFQNSDGKVVEKANSIESASESVFDEANRPTNKLTLERMMQNIAANNWIAKNSEEGRLLEKLQNDLESGRLDEFGQAIDAMQANGSSGPPVGMGLSSSADL